MDQNSENNIPLKDKFISFYKYNKYILYLGIGILITILVSIIFFNNYKEKKNLLISEKYIQAGLYLESKNVNKAKNLYEEIILSENKFYSILALNTILEKDLNINSSQILEYFEIVEKINNSKDQKDLIIFKKALYLIKIAKIQEGKVLLDKLIVSGSTFKILAEEVLSK